MARGSDQPQAVRVRRSLRLSRYDYAHAGAYFVTVCTVDRHCCLGEVIGAGVRLGRFGRVVVEEWMRSALLRSDVSLDEFVVMPNHVHGIVMLTRDVGATRRVAPGRGSASPLRTGAGSGSLGAIIGQFKAASARRINALQDTSGRRFWQRRYHDHVIRSEADLDAIRTYIVNNPLQWALDRENPDLEQRQGEPPGDLATTGANEVPEAT